MKKKEKNSEYICSYPELNNNTEKFNIENLGNFGKVTKFETRLDFKVY